MKLIEVLMVATTSSFSDDGWQQDSLCTQVSKRHLYTCESMPGDPVSCINCPLSCDSPLVESICDAVTGAH